MAGILDLASGQAAAGLNPLALTQYVQQQGIEGEERGKRQRLASLASQAYQAPAGQSRGLIGQMVAQDPVAGMRLGGAIQDSEDERMRRLASMARTMKTVLATGDQGRINATWQSVLPELRQDFPGNYSENWDPNYEPTLQKVISMDEAHFSAKAPNEVKSFEYFTKGMPQGDVDKARRVQLGLDARAVTAAPKSFTLKGADGRERMAQFDPTTASVTVFDEGSNEWLPLGQGAAQAPAQAGGNTSVKLDGVPQEQQQRMANMAALMQQAGYGAPQIDAWMASQLEGGTRDVSPPQFASGTGSAPPRAANPALGVSRSPEEQAALTTAAQEQAKINAEIDAYRSKIPWEAEQAAAIANAKAGVEAAADQAKTQRSNAAALRVYEQGISGLRKGLAATSLSGPVVGRLPAVTSGSRIAQGGVAAMAPILKQIFRTAGEGTFTDSDQKLLMDMLPTREDTSESAASKIANIDAIVRAKLGVAAPNQGGSGSPPAVTTGPRRLKYNPATRKIE